MNSSSNDAAFVRELTSCQHWLRAYVRMLVPSSHETDEVLQRTNLVLWQKSSSFAPGTNFRAWACQVARFEVLAYRKQQCRERNRFGDALVEQLAEDAQQNFGVLDDLREYLEVCLGQLQHRQRKLILERYSGGTVQQIAEREGMSVDALSTALYRIRKALLKCIRGKVD